ncbi:MAG: hypothetical protein UX06_C0028G0002 [Candidatus Giovannonibacteria bacterium GW2011_GWA2_45_21]|uniref:Uncharacterized protein n=1 Tax=Candidatus Giovannonibacteria bacterium GW2011_GWA2_45_21 TaxID=1618649 RepID=A0A0G1PF60_9BACT|nr:MAG: hypothetical protein UX06_C0028G0002 [Candidatus Giovannonibacteria bacterium GW2011_GWA2_45_21]
MLDNQKKLIWLAALAVLGALLFIFYVLTSASGEPNKKTAQESAKFTGVFEDKDKKSAVRQDFYSGREDVITPAIEAFMEAVSSTFNQSAQNFSNESSQASSKPSMAQTFSSPSLAVTVTEQEVFEFGYNSEYINVLKDTNKEMIDGGFLASGAVYPLTNMTEAIALQDKYADYLESLMVGIEGGGLTKDDIDKYRRSYRVILPSLWKEELVAIKSISKNSSIFEKIYFTYRQKTAHQKASSELSLSQIREIFIKTAEAAYSINPCYREGAPNLIRGSQRSAPCCNCGITGSRCRTYTGGGGTTSPTPTPTPSTTPTPGVTPTPSPSPTPTGLKCSADSISPQVQAIINCVMSGAAAQNLLINQPTSNQLNAGCHTCRMPNNPYTGCSSWTSGPTNISCHYGGTQCNGAGNAVDFSLSAPTRTPQNWDKLRNLATSCGASGAWCEAGSIRFIGTCSVVDIDHVHANASGSCGCN